MSQRAGAPVGGLFIDKSKLIDSDVSQRDLSILQDLSNLNINPNEKSFNEIDDRKKILSTADIN